MNTTKNYTCKYYDATLSKRLSYYRKKTLILYYLLKIARRSQDTTFRAYEEEKVAVLIKKYILFLKEKLPSLNQ